ncbi:MAG: ankyrin repeat domain-containing protein [Leptospiraceae bacterium]|nr:ankyrin repeat domain-containing protein [Leptospiraceae bacterium]
METDFELIEETPYKYANEDLFCSIYYEYVDGVKRAIKDGADVNYRYNNIFFSEYYFAFEFERVKWKDNYTPLMIAIEKKNIAIIKLLLENGAKPYGWNSLGHTPLVVTIRDSSDSDILKLLLEYGADPNENCMYGITLRFAESNYPKAYNIMSSYVKSKK